MLPTPRGPALRAGLLVLAVVLATTLVGMLAPPVGPGRAPESPTHRTGVTTPPTVPVEQPSIVVVVMDDVSMDLVPSMANLARLSRRGATYRHSYVVNSLCCPSRAAMLTGRPPHLSGVLTNTSAGPLGPKGGWRAFRAHHGPQRSYNVALHDAGYRTAFVGKYLNEYEPGDPDGKPGGRRTPPPVVPGWDDFESISGEGYDGWGYYRTTDGGRGEGYGLRHYPVPKRSAPRRVKDRTHVQTVIGERAVSLARRYEQGERPYLLHVAPYAAHARYSEIWPDEPIFPPAFRDRPGPRHPQGNCGALRCGRVDARRLPGYDAGARKAAPRFVGPDGRTRRAPAWRTDPVTLSHDEATTRLRDRMRMVQGVDRMLGRLMRVVGPDTYLVVTSDNGFHLRQLGLNGGKGTPYAADTQVPLVVAGPGIAPGTRPQAASSIDLAPTFEDLAGVPVAPWRAGTSLVPSLLDRRAEGSRFTFAEHRQGPVRPGEPDADLGSGGRLDAIPSYVAVRSARGLLVRVDLDRSWRRTRYAWELYSSRRESETRNVFAARHDEPWVQDLRRRLLAWEDCRPAQCRRLAR